MLRERYRDEQRAREQQQQQQQPPERGQERREGVLPAAAPARPASPAEAAQPAAAAAADGRPLSRADSGGARAETPAVEPEEQEEEGERAASPAEPQREEGEVSPERSAGGATEPAAATSEALVPPPPPPLPPEQQQQPPQQQTPAAAAPLPQQEQQQQGSGSPARHLRGPDWSRLEDEGVSRLRAAREELQVGLGPASPLTWAGAPLCCLRREWCGLLRQGHSAGRRLPACLPCLAQGAHCLSGVAVGSRQLASGCAGAWGAEPATAGTAG